MSLVNRAIAILSNPKQEWQTIAAEQPNQGAILTGYVLPLSLIPAVCEVIGWLIAGGTTALWWGIGRAAISIVTSVAVVYIAAALVNALAPTFNGRQDSGRAFQLVAYSMTPAWVAGALNLFPAIQILAAVGSLYGFYLIYLGVTPLMETPIDKRFPYTIATFVVLFVAFFILTAILATVVLGMFGLSLAGMAGR